MLSCLASSLFSSLYCDNGGETFYHRGKVFWMNGGEENETSQGSFFLRNHGACCEFVSQVNSEEAFGASPFGEFLLFGILSFDLEEDLSDMDWSSSRRLFL